MRADGDLEARVNAVVATLELGRMGVERHLFLPRLHPCRLTRRRPQAFAVIVAQVEPSAVRIARRIGDEPGECLPVPQQPAATGCRNPRCQASIAEQLHLRKGRPCRAPPVPNPVRAKDIRFGLGAFQPLDLGRKFVRDALRQQQRRQPDSRIAGEALDQPVARQQIADGAHDHALVMRHEGIDRSEIAGARRRAPRREIDRFPQTVAASGAQFLEPLEIGLRRDRIDRQRQGRCVGGDHVIAREPAAQPEARHTERAIAETAFRVARGEGGFGNPPRCAVRAPVGAMRLHRHAIAFAEQGLRLARHQQARHQIFEHRAVPRDQRQPAGHARDRPSKMEPVFERDFLFRDRQEARDAGFRCEQIVVMHIGFRGADIVTDDEQAPLAIVEPAEVHLPGEPLDFAGQSGQIRRFRQRSSRIAVHVVQVMPQPFEPCVEITHLVGPALRSALHDRRPIALERRQLVVYQPIEQPIAIFRLGRPRLQLLIDPCQPSAKLLGIGELLRLFRRQPEEILQPGPALALERLPPAGVAQTGRIAQQRRGEIAAIDRRHIAWLERAQVVGIVPVEEVAAEPFEPRKAVEHVARPRGQFGPPDKAQIPRGSGG